MSVVKQAHFYYDNYYHLVIMTFSYILIQVCNAVLISTDLFRKLSCKAFY